MIRRFVNLVVQDYATGARALHRLDVAKHLFYPSAARAESASAKNKEKDSSNNGNGGGNKMPRITRSRLLRQLPPPTMCLQRFPAAHDDHASSPPHETFALLGGSDGSRILHAGVGGQVVLYDADAVSTTALPDLAFAQPKGLKQPLFISIADAGAGAGKNKESLYVITDRHEWNYKRHNLEVIDLSQLPQSRWEHLPPPPFITRSTPTCAGVRSFAVVDGGRAICVSLSSRKNKGTYCFDMSSREWWHAGGWKLPFRGRAEYVPELCSWLGSTQGCWHAGDSRLPSSYGQAGRDYVPQRLWPGTCTSCFDDLCSSSDLSAVMSSVMDARGGGAGAVVPPPKLQHVWQDVIPDDKEELVELKGRLGGVVLSRTIQWLLTGRDIVNLGGGRFCIAKFFRVQRVVRWGFEESDVETEAEFVELSGVEVAHGSGGGGDGGELRMVKHKSRRYMFKTDEIKCVL